MVFLRYLLFILLFLLLNGIYNFCSAQVVVKKDMMNFYYNDSIISRKHFNQLPIFKTYKGNVFPLNDSIKIDNNDSIDVFLFFLGRVAYFKNIRPKDLEGLRELEFGYIEMKELKKLPKERNKLKKVDAVFEVERKYLYNSPKKRLKLTIWPQNKHFKGIYYLRFYYYAGKSSCIDCYIKYQFID